MNYRRLHGFFASRRERSAPLVLATVCETRGSTYSKPGAQMLIGADGVFQGMLSGGCLEGDLAIRAQVVVESGVAQSVLYDLSDDNDELWGLGVGCDGAMRVFLQPLTLASNYEPFATIASLQAEHRGVEVATVVTGSHALPAAATALSSGDRSWGFGLEAAAREALLAELASLGDANGCKTVSVGDSTSEVFFGRIAPLPRLLVLGAGLDAEPVVGFAHELGWVSTIVDHRPAYLQRGDFGLAESTLCCPAAELSAHVDIDAFDLAIVMSHHLASDRAYLGVLAQASMAYIGLLGPTARRDRLLGELGDPTAKLLEGRLHSPAGLDLGGRGPAAIALSIVAEMQERMSRR